MSDAISVEKVNDRIADIGVTCERDYNDTLRATYDDDSVTFSMQRGDTLQYMVVGSLEATRSFAKALLMMLEDWEDHRA